MGVLLNIPDDNFRQLIDYVKQMDKQAKPSGWTPDLLLWFMLNSRMKEQEKQKYAETLAYPRLYNGLYKVKQAPNVRLPKMPLTSILIGGIISIAMHHGITVI